MKKRTVSLALALLTAFSPALTRVPEGIRSAAAVSAAGDIQLTAVEVALPAYPIAGETPDPAGCEVTVGSLESVRWIDMAEKRELTTADPFRESMAHQEGLLPSRFHPLNLLRRSLPAWSRLSQKTPRFQQQLQSPPPIQQLQSSPPVQQPVPLLSPGIRS